MSEPSRAQRRQQARSGNAPPPRRDPMRNVYIGFLALIVIVILIFVGQRIYAQHQYAIASATPTPAAGATSKPIQLLDGENLGKAEIAVAKNGLADTTAGGRGAPVDGITCTTSEQVTLHIHSHLAVFVNGTQIQIPRYIGMAPSPTGGCLYWLHTHDGSGILHVESPQFSAPNGGPFTLGMFFDIWGQPLTPAQVGPFKGAVTAYVNGTRYSGDLRSIPLFAHQQIVLEIGKTFAPPNYAFPPLD